jgi:hypothetical protein
VSGIPHIERAPLLRSLSSSGTTSDSVVDERRNAVSSKTIWAGAEEDASALRGLSGERRAISLQSRFRARAVQASALVGFLVSSSGVANALSEAVV